MSTDSGLSGNQLALNERIRVYVNSGNRPLIDLLLPHCRRILDVGCGAGDNAARIRERGPGNSIYGVTQSPTEAAVAKRHMDGTMLGV